MSGRDDPAWLAWSRGQRASEDGDLPTALRWLARARRLLPDDDLIGLTLGSMRLAAGDAAGGASLLRPIAERGSGAPAWAALAAAELACAAEWQAYAAAAMPNRAGLAELVSTMVGRLAQCETSDQPRHVGDDPADSAAPDSTAASMADLRERDVSALAWAAIVDAELVHSAERAREADAVLTSKPERAGEPIGSSVERWCGDDIGSGVTVRITRDRLGRDGSPDDVDDPATMLDPSVAVGLVEHHAPAMAAQRQSAAIVELGRLADQIALAGLVSCGNDESSESRPRFEKNWPGSTGTAGEAAGDAGVGPRTAIAAMALAARAVGRAAGAVSAALQQGLVTPELAALAGRVAMASGRPGWCGIGPDWRLQTGGASPGRVLLDGEAIGSAEVLDRGETVVVGEAGAWLGSPLPVGRMRAVRGFVADVAGGLEGWAHRPADPDHAPRLTLVGPGGRHLVVPDTEADGVEGVSPLARPWWFRVDAATAASVGRPARVIGPDGRELLGSPVWIGIVPDAPIVEAARVDRRLRPVDIVMPVHGAAAATLAGLRAVLGSLPADSVVHVVDDASPDAALGAALDRMAAAGQIRLHRHVKALGFPGAANAGLLAAAGRDVVLLNSDTVVPPGWLERLRAAAYSGETVGTATPLSGDGTIVSYGDGAAGLDAVAAAANAGQVATLPVGVGFCLFMRRDCLDQVGPLREDLFAQGYGEESDFCLRAASRGWRHVAALDVFVEHLGGRSFGAGRTDLRRRNQAILERHHPGFAKLVAAHEAADPLFEARRRMDALRWAAGRQGEAVVLVSHGAGGGVDELVAARGAALRADGVRPVVLVPAAGGCRVEGYGDLRFAVPGEVPALAALLRFDGVRHVEVHHLLGHDHAVLGLARALGVPVESWVHDAAAFCPRIALIGPERRYCGEPALAACVACVAQAGSNLVEPIGVEALVARSATDLAGSLRVVVPSADMARRLRRHFPAVRAEVVPWEDDRGWPAVRPRPVTAVARVCVVGAIGVEKGYDVLLGCAADARRRRLALEFVVCGTTADDERLMAAGPVFVTGRYGPDEAVALIRVQEAAVAFIPSIWPETWCFALSRAWGAGLAAVVFDVGAPAERVRTTGRGWVLPLGLPVERVNDELLRLASVPAGLQP